jgi:1,4-dihydroxy-2-naphthoyl-CoA hydrolase
MTAWNYKTTIRLHQTDAAGVIFYADLFVMAHECYESWLEPVTSLAGILEQNILVPIVHAEADYKLPMRLSERITIELSLIKKQTTSFILQYRFVNAEGLAAATAQTVHAVIDSQTRKPIPIPAFLEKALASL